MHITNGNLFRAKECPHETGTCVLLDRAAWVTPAVVLRAVLCPLLLVASKHFCRKHCSCKFAARQLRVTTPASTCAPLPVLDVDPKDEIPDVRHSGCRRIAVDKES